MLSCGLRNDAMRFGQNRHTRLRGWQELDTHLGRLLKNNPPTPAASKAMKNRLISRISLAAFLLTLLTATDAIAQSKLERFENCQFIETDWCDGDSFRVKDASAKKFTIRLYGVDCVETHVQSNSDSTRLRSQRRYFGISNLGGNSSTSIIAAKKMGNEARDYVIGELKEPFTVITAWADARGDGRFKRHYGFITTGKGHDLADRSAFQCGKQDNFCWLVLLRSSQFYFLSHEPTIFFPTSVL